jgi:hypothetical protein
MYDDDVDMLFLGVTDARDDVEGLLVWAGMMSESHKNSQLKRICGPVVSLMKHLVLEVDFGGDSSNIFFDRFTRLPLKELKNINFVAHFTQFGASRDKSSLLDLYELITVIVKDHRNSDSDNVEPLDVEVVLASPDAPPASVAACKEGYLAWLHRAATAEIGGAGRGTSTAGGMTTSSGTTGGMGASATQGGNMSEGTRGSTMTSTVTGSGEKADKERSDREYRQWMQSRPRTWADVKVKQVPLQPDEEGYGDKVGSPPRSLLLFAHDVEISIDCLSSLLFNLACDNCLMMSSNSHIGRRRRMPVCATYLWRIHWASSKATCANTTRSMQVSVESSICSNIMIGPTLRLDLTSISGYLMLENADVLTIAERATLLEAKFGKRFSGSSTGPAPRDLLSLMRRIEITGKRQKEQQQAQSAAAATAAATAAAVLSSAAAARSRTGSAAPRSVSEMLENGSSTPSLLPFEKSFSAAAYLTLVHSNASLSELSEGLQVFNAQYLWLHFV